MAMLTATAIAQNTFPASGSVGIGTTSPTQALDVRGSVYTNGSVLVDGGDLIFKRTTHTFGFVARTNIAGYKNLGFCVEGGSELESMWFNSASNSFTGKLGVGMFPQYKFDISTNSQNDGIRINTAAGFTLWHGNSLGPGSWNAITKNGDAGIIYGSGVQPSGSNVSFGFVIAPWHNNMTGLRIDNEGNVGVATNDTKGYRFAVNGDAIFTRIKVKQFGNWPDYVFDKQYNLPSLRDVEEYIKQYRHLPGIASADEIAKEGLDVGENQAALLKKIEELTLYIIRQEKEIETLKESNRMIAALQQEIEKIKKYQGIKN